MCNKRWQYMTSVTYTKAKMIQDRIDKLRELRYIATKSYKRFGLVKKFLWMSDYDKREVYLCDDGLTELVRDYCDKRINELKEELEAL